LPTAAIAIPPGWRGCATKGATSLSG
jgi:hypothetical protein